MIIRILAVIGVLCLLKAAKNAVYDRGYKDGMMKKEQNHKWFKSLGDKN